MRQATKKRQQADQLNPFRTPKAISPYHQAPQPPVKQNRPFRHVYQKLMYKHLAYRNLESPFKPVDKKTSPKTEDLVTNDQTTDTTLNNSDVKNGINDIANRPTLGEAAWLEQDKNDDKEVTETLGNTGTKEWGPTLRRSQSEDGIRKEKLGTTLRRSQSEDNIQKANPFFNVYLNSALVSRTPTSSRQGSPRPGSVENTEERFPPTGIFHWPQYGIGHHVAQKDLRLPKSEYITYDTKTKVLTIQTSDQTKDITIIFPQRDTLKEENTDIIINHHHENSKITVKQGDQTREYNQITYGGSYLRLRSTDTDITNEWAIELEPPPQMTSQYALIPTENNPTLKTLIEGTDGCSVTSCKHKSMNLYTEAVGHNMMTFMKSYNLCKVNVLNTNQQLTLRNSRFEYLAGLAYQTTSFQEEVTLQLIADLIMAIFHIDDILDCRDENKIRKDKKLRLIQKSQEIWNNPNDTDQIINEEPTDFLKTSLQALSILKTRLTQLLETKHPDLVNQLMELITIALNDYISETRQEDKDFSLKNVADLATVRESRRKTTAITFFCALGFAIIGNPEIIENDQFKEALKQANNLVGSDNDCISHPKETREGNAGRNIITVRSNNAISDQTNETATEPYPIEDPLAAEQVWRKTEVNLFESNIVNLINNVLKITDETKKKQSLECIMLLINWVNGNIIWSALSARYRNLLESIGEQKVGLANEVLITQLKQTPLMEALLQFHQTPSTIPAAE